MNPRLLFVLAALTMVLLFSAPVTAAPQAQTGVDEVLVDEVVVTSSTTFTLTVRLDEVTTVAIPMQVDWRAEGPLEESDEEVSVIFSPSVLRTGIFSVTVDPFEPTTGSLAITLTQPADDIAPTTTTTTTSTSAITVTTAITDTVPSPNATTANAESNFRAGPGTEYEIVGSAQAGDELDVVGQNSDGTWLVLANDAWIAAFLIDNPPADLPVVTPPATPSPTPEVPASAIPIPTATP